MTRERGWEIAREVLAERFSTFSDPNLRWDWHCVTDEETRGLIESELQSRGADLHGYMERHAGPVGETWQWCGHCICATESLPSPEAGEESHPSV